MNDRSDGQPNIPIEVISLILKELQGNPIDLRSCALTCHSWLPIAREHLYSSVSMCQAPMQVQDRRCKKLRDVLDKYPDLAGWIREIYIHWSSNAAASLFETRQFQNLRKVELSYISWTPPTVEIVSRIFTFPCVETIVMHYDNFRSFHDFTRLFEFCTSPLRSIWLRNVNFLTAEPLGTLLRNSQVPRSSQTQLGRLTIENGTTRYMIPWFLSPGCSIGLGGLKFLSYKSAESFDLLWTLLRKHGASLEHLEIRSIPDWQSQELETIDMGQALPNVKRVLFSAGSPAALEYVTRWISQLGQRGRLAEITIEVPPAQYRYLVSERSSEIWRRFDSVVSNIQTSQLEKVTIMAPRQTSMPPTLTGAGRELLVMWLPLLGKGNVLHLG